jgi:hypothetical protein
MGSRAAGASGKFSAFRSTDFDSAIFLAFDGDFELVEAYEVPAASVGEARLIGHVNARQPTLREVRAFGGTDVADEMKAAYASLDSQVLAQFRFLTTTVSR